MIIIYTIDSQDKSLLNDFAKKVNYIIHHPNGWSKYNHIFSEYDQTLHCDIDDLLYIKLVNKNTAEIKIERPAEETNSQPPLGSGNFVPSGVTPGTPTGTFVGKKVVELRGELNRLQSNISQQNGELQKLRGQLVANSRQYHGTIAAVNARLQVGTTPGNPILVQQFKSAQGDLSRVAEDIAEMNTLATSIGSSSTMSSFLCSPPSIVSPTYISTTWESWTSDTNWKQSSI